MKSGRLSVATECPSCGAPVDFGEGSNALACGHCRTNLLVTGRKRVLSYWIPPRIDAEAARFAVNDGRTRAGEARLWFLPYYRITAFEIRTELVLTPASEQIGNAWTADPTLGEAGFRAVSLRRSELPVREPELRDRFLEKNFLAADLGPRAPYSLGVRPSVLRLELFRRGAIEAHGTIVAPSIDPAAALEVGTRPLGEARILARAILAMRLALVYFPFWTIEVRRDGAEALALVDGVTGTVAQRDLDDGFLERLARPLRGDGETVGFRPLLCPNCGWDLPLRPDDCVFCCRGCRRAWEIEGAELRETRVDVAAPPPPAKPRRRAADRPLPFWRLRGEDGASRLVPAFRFRRMKSLVDLATGHARRPPAIELSADERPELSGAFFDREDAHALARFVESPATGDDGLVWIPYAADGYSLVDPYLGLGLPKNLVL